MSEDNLVRKLEVENQVRCYSYLKVINVFADEAAERAPAKRLNFPGLSKNVHIVDKSSELVLGTLHPFITRDSELFAGIPLIMQEAHKRGWVVELEAKPIALIERAAIEAQDLKLKVLLYSLPQELIEINQRADELVQDRPAAPGNV